MNDIAFQDQYPEDYANCYGCGRNNENGLHLKSYWQGNESICNHTPDKRYSGGFPGFVYGGLLLSLMDCHGAGTASAAKTKELGSVERFVTASLSADFLKPTPLGVELEVRCRVEEIDGRKVFVRISVSAENEVRVKGRALYVQITSQ